MTKEETLAEFLLALKTVLNIAALYSKDHPYFLKAIDDFKIKLDPVFGYLDPLKIDATSSSVILDGKASPDSPSTKEIAGILHKRKIKSVQIKKESSNRELAHFIHSISLRPREILNAGGIGKFISKGELRNIAVEELDYSELLKGGREDVVDVWSYLLEEAVDKNDAEKINDLADNFSKVISHLKINDFLSDQGMNKNLSKFFDYLKGHETVKFEKCSQGFFKAIISDKKFTDYQKLDKIKVFLKDMKEENIAGALLDQLCRDKNFDKHNLDLFSILFTKDKHRKIASLLEEKVNDIEYLRDRVAAKDKIQELFSTESSSTISEVYRNTLTHLLTGISFKDKYTFDQDLIVINYELTLLELINSETDKEQIILITKRINRDFEHLSSRKEWEYLRRLAEILNRIKAQDPTLTESVKELDIKISGLFESMIWDEKLLADVEFLEDYCQISTKWPEFYLDRIFKEEIFTPAVFKLYFRFFPNSTDLFCNYLNNKRSQLKFLIRVTESLKKVKTEPLLHVLKYIYGISDTLVKVEVLKTMQSLSLLDHEFLLMIIEEDNFIMKRGAMLIIKGDAHLQKKALDKLFLIKNPFGIRNRIVLDNLRVVEELKIKEAIDHLNRLSKKRFFWYRPIRDRAKSIRDQLV